MRWYYTLQVHNDIIMMDDRKECIICLPFFNSFTVVYCTVAVSESISAPTKQSQPINQESESSVGHSFKREFLVYVVTLKIQNVLFQ